MNTSKQRLSAAGASFLIALLMGGPAQSAPFELTILKPVPGRETAQAQYGLNLFGSSVGTSGRQGVRRATVWNRSGEPLALAQRRGAIFSRASDINDRNTIVGTMDTTGANDLSGLRAVRWTSPTHFEYLLPETGYYNDAFSINDAEWIVGIQFTGSVYTAFVRRPSGELYWPAPLHAGDDFELLSVNIVHQAAGFDAGEAGPFAVKWSERGGLEKLPLLPGGTVSATASINDWGTVAGVADDAAGALRAVRWYENGKVVALDSLPNAIYSDTQNGINDWGFSVGVTVYAGTDPNDFNSQRATLWDYRGRPYDLNDLITPSAYTLLTATSINDFGLIFGDAIDSHGARFAYLLAPSREGWHGWNEIDPHFRATRTEYLTTR